MTMIQKLRREVSPDEKYPLPGIIAAVLLNLLSPYISGLLPLLALLICVIRVMRYDEKIFTTDYCILISVSMLFRTTGGMSLLIYLCLFADVWYFIRRGIRAEATVVLAVLLLNYLLLRTGMAFNEFALCFGQLFLLRILLPAQSEHSAERSARAFCMSLILSSAYALLLRNTWQLEAIRGPEAPAFFGSSLTRFYGLFQDPNYYSMLMITGIALQIKLKDAKRIGWPTFIFTSLVLIVFGVLTYSKTFFIMMLLLVCIYLVWQFWNKKVLRGVLMTLAIVVVGGILLFSEGSPFAVVLERLSSSSNLNELTTGRSDVFMAYFNAITDSLGSAFFGAGLGANNLGRDPHNLFLELAYYIGIVGLVLVVLYYCSLVRAVGRQDKTISQQNVLAKYAVLLVVVIVHFTLHGMTTFPTYASFCMAALSMRITAKKEDVPCQN